MVVAPFCPRRMRPVFVVFPELGPQDHTSGVACVKSLSPAVESLQSKGVPEFKVSQIIACHSEPESFTSFRINSAEAKNLALDRRFRHCSMRFFASLRSAQNDTVGHRCVSCADARDSSLHCVPLRLRPSASLRTGSGQAAQTCPERSPERSRRRLAEGMTLGRLFFWNSPSPKLLGNNVGSGRLGQDLVPLGLRFPRA